MRLLLLCDEAPDRSSATANGSTMITANVIPRLPPEVEVHLAYCDDGRRVLDVQVVERCASVTAVPMRSRRLSLLAAPFTRLPRATWRRTTEQAYSAVRAEAERCAVVLVHGFHAFALGQRLADDVRVPLIVQEIDAWADHWREQALRSRRPMRTYLLSQARRARRLERAVAGRAARYLVVAPDEAERLGRALGREVLAVPNGVDVQSFGVGAPAAVHEPRDRPVIGFLGTLDYPPNVEAIASLCRDVLPRVRRSLPGAHVRIAGRRLGPPVARFASEHVEVVGEVADPREFYRSVTLMAFPGSTGTGAKNTVLEAMISGAPVVASRTAARGLPIESPIVVAADAAALAGEIVALLQDDDRRVQLGRAAQEWATVLPDWHITAQRYAEVLFSVGPARAEGRCARST